MKIIKAPKNNKKWLILNGNYQFLQKNVYFLNDLM